MKKSILFWFVVLVVLLIIIAKIPLIFQNFPVAVNPDERTSLRILNRFTGGNYNPHFFHYPTFYYYLTFFLSPFSNSQNIIISGRIINHLLTFALALIVFLFTKRLSSNYIPATIAFLLILSSPIIAKSSSYIITDILLSLLIVAASYEYYNFFETHDYKHWFAGIALNGLAISTKYTALLLTISYILYEFFYSRKSNQIRLKTTSVSRFLDKEFSTRLLALILAGCGAILLLFYFFFPQDILRQFISTTGEINSHLDEKDMIFVNSLRNKLGYLSILFLVLSGLVSFRFKFIRRICLVRPYAGVLLQIVIFFLGSPFALLSFKRFIYDFGAELKENALGGIMQQWTVYPIRYLNNESLIVFAFFLIGLSYCVLKRIRIGYIIIYLCVSYLVIGSATRGADRYLTPLLPFFFIIASLGIFQIITAFQNKYKRSYYIPLSVLVILISIEIGPKFIRAIKPIQELNEMSRTYKWVSESGITQVYYTGYFPDVELRNRGVEVIEITKELGRPDTKAFLDTLAYGNFLAVNHKTLETNPHFPDSTFKLVFHVDEIYGQYVYRKTRPQVNKY